MVVAQAGSEAGVGRPHFAAAMVAVGAAESIDDAFDRYLTNRRPGFVPKARLSAAEVARLATASGGVAVLAHPYSLGLDGPDLARVVGELAAAGFAGIEAIYGRYSPRQRQRARKPGPPFRPGGHRRLRPPRADQARPPGRHRPGRPQGARPGARPARGPSAGRLTRPA